MALDRRLYGTELEDMSPGEIADEFKQKLASLRGVAAKSKGLTAEYMGAVGSVP